jgi:hypothetical protein
MPLGLRELVELPPLRYCPSNYAHFVVWVLVTSMKTGAANFELATSLSKCEKCYNLRLM